MRRFAWLAAAVLAAGGCAGGGGSDFKLPASNGPLGSTRMPGDAQPAKTALNPVRATEAVPNDPDDPAIWIHPKDAAKSLILGTDKHEKDGGLYVFDLNGKIVQKITGLDRPNNVDVLQGASIGGRKVDLAAVTERAAEQIRLYAISPENGSLSDVTGRTKVFQDAKDDERLPMGIALWRRPGDGAVFAFVSPKSGPKTGYLAQFQLKPGADGKIDLLPVRRMGSFSGPNDKGSGEIEALAVDPQKGRLYYADELAGIRAVSADPKAKPEDAIFAKELYQGDREGLAVVSLDKTRVLLSSDQIKGGSKLMVWDISSHQPKRLAALETPADDTDGIDATAKPLGQDFPEGLVVMMNSRDKNFLLFSLAEVKRAVQAGRR